MTLPQQTIELDAYDAATLYGACAGTIDIVADVRNVHAGGTRGEVTIEGHTYCVVRAGNVWVTE